MHIVIMVLLVIVWAALQRHYVSLTGHAPPSRGSLRRRRKKARELGVDPADLDYNHRVEPADWATRVTSSTKINAILWLFSAGVLAMFLLG